MGSIFRVINFNLKMKSIVLLWYGEIKISLMGVMAGHFVGMDPPLSGLICWWCAVGVVYRHLNVFLSTLLIFSLYSFRSIANY